MGPIVLLFPGCTTLGGEGRGGKCSELNNITLYIKRMSMVRSVCVLYLTPDTDLMKSMEPNSCQSISLAAVAGVVSVTPEEGERQHSQTASKEAHCTYASTNQWRCHCEVSPEPSHQTRLPLCAAPPSSKRNSPVFRSRMACAPVDGGHAMSVIPHTPLPTVYLPSS